MTGTTWADGHFVGGHAALDLCNTVYRRLPEIGAELLDSSMTLQRWLDRIGLMPADSDDVDETTLAAALDLRSALWTAFDDQRASRAVDPDALTRVLDHAHAHAVSLEMDARGAVTSRTAAATISALALAALRLLLHPPNSPVRACDRCGWFFIDTSRGRRRRWCSMQTCGNVHKVSRYRDSR